MDHAAQTVHVVQTQQDLLGDLLDEVHGHAFILVKKKERKDMYEKRR